MCVIEGHKHPSVLEMRGRGGGGGGGGRSVNKQQLNVILCKYFNAVHMAIANIYFNNGIIFLFLSDFYYEINYYI